MLIAFVIVIDEYIVRKTFNSAIYVAIMPEICQVLKIYIMMRVIANYAHKRITDLVSPKCVFLFLSPYSHHYLHLYCFNSLKLINGLLYSSA